VFLPIPLKSSASEWLTRPESPTPVFSRQAPFITAFWEIYNEGSLPPSSSASPPAPAALITGFPLLKFYRGFSVTMTGIVPYAGVSFLNWGFLLSHFVQYKPEAAFYPIANLTTGAISGAIAQMVWYPFEVVRGRMQVGGIAKPERGWKETAMDIWKIHG
jgi:solute carrier family 25 protein 16